MNIFKLCALISYLAIYFIYSVRFQQFSGKKMLLFKMEIFFFSTSVNYFGLEPNICSFSNKNKLSEKQGNIWTIGTNLHSNKNILNFITVF